jgi:sugar phosphate isomerase/epimerase
MRLFTSLSTACLIHLPLPLTIRLAAEAGFDGVELVMGPAAWQCGPDTVQRLMREHGLRIRSVHQTLMRRNPRGGEEGRLTDAVEMALRLEEPVVVVIHAPEAFRWAAPLAQGWLRALAACQQRTAGSGVRLAVENAGLYAPFDTHKVLGQLPLLVAFAARHDLQMTLDTCHVGTTGGDLFAAYALMRPRLANIHFSDYIPMHLPEGFPALKTLFSHHQMPGHGTLALRELVARLTADGYTAPLSMEISPAALRAWSLAETRRRLREAVQFVRDAAQGN